MSYLNNVYVPVTHQKYLELAKTQDFYEQNETRDGFDNMLELMGLGDEYVFANKQGQRAVMFMLTDLATALDVNDIYWRWHDRETFFDDADCFVFVKDLDHYIDWSKVKDVDVAEKQMEMLQGSIAEHGELLVLIPQ